MNKNIFVDDIYVDDVRGKEYDIIFLSCKDSYDGKDDHGLYQIFKYFHNTLEEDCAFISIFDRQIPHPENYLIYDTNKHNTISPDLVTRLPKHNKIIMGDKNDVLEAVLSLILEKYNSEIFYVTMVNNAHTGLCAYPTSHSCEKYKHSAGCYSCPDILERLLKEHGPAIYEKPVAPEASQYAKARFDTHAAFLEKYSDRVTLCAVSTFALEQAAESYLYKDVRKLLTPLKNVFPAASNTDELFRIRAMHKEMVLREVHNNGFKEVKKLCYWSAWDPSIPRKGLRYYIDALHLLVSEHLTPEQVAEIGFIFSGDPKKMGFYHSLMPGAAKKIIVPLLMSEQVVECLCASDLYVCTTLEDAGPRTVGEALACGTPVVSFDRCVATDLVDSSCGSLVKTYDVKALAAAMAKVLTSTDTEINDYSLNAYKSFNNFYSDENMKESWTLALEGRCK